VQELGQFLKAETPITDAVTAQYTAVMKEHPDSDFAAVRASYDQPSSDGAPKL